jgi:hypothetical protein
MKRNNIDQDKNLIWRIKGQNKESMKQKAGSLKR